jgi:hypothetical protein
MEQELWIVEFGVLTVLVQEPFSLKIYSSISIPSAAPRTLG